MNVVRIVSGIIFFDDFTEDRLDSSWEAIPNDSKRFSTVENPGSLKIYHGTPDIVLLRNEPEEYVLDLQNNYSPLSDQVQAGLVVYRGTNDNLEVLEYYDSTKDETFVYEYLRLVKSGNIYTAYCKNHVFDDWQIVGSGEFKSAGKIGLTVKGPPVQGSSDYEIQNFKMYSSQWIQVLNVPVGYTVALFKDNTSILDVVKSLDPFNGIKFNIDEVPPVERFFKVYDTNNKLVHTSSKYQMCGGDVYYYGAVLDISVDGNDLYQDGEYFLGTFKGGEILFEISIHNKYETDFNAVVLTTQQYETNNGFSWVKFSLDGQTYEDFIRFESISANATISVHGKITRDVKAPSVVEPYKFMIKLLYS